MSTQGGEKGRRREALMMIIEGQCRHSAHIVLMPPAVVRAELGGQENGSGGDNWRVKLVGQQNT